MAVNGSKIAIARRQEEGAPNRSETQDLPGLAIDGSRGHLRTS